MALSLSSRRFSVAFAVVLALAIAGCSSSEDRAKSYFERGEQFVAQGEVVKASLEFRNALKLKSNYPEAQFALAQTQEQQGAYNDALRGYLAVAEQVPTHLEARERLSYLLMAGGDIDGADKYAQQAAAIAKDDPGVMVLQAAVAMKRGETSKGIELAKAALAADPAQVDALMVLASERMAGSDPAGALAYLEQAPADNEGNVGLQVLKLTALDALGDQPSVEALFTKLVALYPETAGFRDGLMRWYLSKGRSEDAEQLARRYADENPDNVQARLDLIGLVASIRGSSAAVAEVEEAIRARSRASGDTYELQLALAQMKSEAGAGDQAVDVLKAVVAETTDAAKRNKARVQLARLLGQQGNQDEAAEVVEAVVSEDARNVDALSVRASLRLLKGDNADAITDLLQAVNEAPEDFSVRGLLAEAYERDGSAVLAEEQYAKALEFSRFDPKTGLPVARFFLKYGKTDQAMRTLEAVRRRAPDNREVLGMLAQLKLAARDWVGAQQIADTLRQLGSNGDATTADRIGAAALSGLSRYDDSIKLLEDSIATEGNRTQLLPDLITAYLQSGKQDAAQKYLEDLVATKPDDSQALILLAVVHMRSGKADLAEKALVQAAERGAGLAGDIALAQYYTSAGKFEAAETVINAGLEQEPRNAVLTLSLAALYEKTERFEDAITVYQALYDENPSAGNVANDLASLISERRNDAASLDAAFEIAKRLRGSDVPQYLDTLGWIYYLRGEYDEALPLLRAAASRLSDSPLVQYHLGMTYRALGQVKLAQENLQRAVEMTPPLIPADHQRATEALEALASTSASKDKPNS